MIALQHPRKLTEALVAAAAERGAVVQTGIVEGIVTASEDGTTKVTGVSLQGGTVLECDSVIVALGPWSSAAADWFPHSIPRGIGGQKYTSIVMPTDPDETTATCLFTNSSDNVELYPRPGAMLLLLSRFFFLLTFSHVFLLTFSQTSSTHAATRRRRLCPLIRWRSRQLRRLLQRSGVSLQPARKFTRNNELKGSVSCLRSLF